MGLLTSYGKLNRVVSDALSIRYYCTPLQKSIQVKDGTLTIYYTQVNRAATKRYDYVGMTYVAAIACRNAKVAKYTRMKNDEEQKVFDIEQEKFVPRKYQACQADITATHEAGGMWKVSISVNESDTAFCYGKLPQDLSTLFFDLSFSDYDETEE